MSDFTPTAEQLAIIEAARTGQSLMVHAYAGSAKTTTLVALANAMPWTSGLFLAFNVKIKQELEKKLPKHFTCMTLNGLGHRAWGKAIGKQLVLDDKKLGKILTEMLKRQQIEASADAWTSALALVQGAMQAGLVPKAYPHRGLVADSDEAWADIAEGKWIELTPPMLAIARATLEKSVALAFAGNISFDDQIYMSAMYNGVFPRFQHVLGDEAQDMSPLNHIQMARCAADQIIVVGDDKQAIYAFRGADSNSMQNLRKIRPEWIDLKLSTTFRCPKAVVARQQAHAPGFNAFHTNVEGNVENWQRTNIIQNGAGWNWNKLIVLNQSPIAMLCRNNAPLLSMAFRLIRNRIGCTVLGRDIGKSLISLSKKIIPEDNTAAVDCMALVRKWREGQCDLAMANGKEEKIASIVDRAECLQAVLEDANVEDAKALRASLEFLFSRGNGIVTLSSIHRAKGLEWPCVVHLDPWRLPSRFAQKRAKEGDPSQLIQENNLQYVCETRAMHTLILANVEDFQ